MVKEYIKSNEGLRLKPYKCSAGKLTIGYGRNLDDKGISVEEAEIMLNFDIKICIYQLYHIIGFDFFESLSRNRQTVLVDLIFNLGQSGFLRFKKMINALMNKNFIEAAKQVLDSNYARQLPNRSKRNADMMREG